MPESFNGYRLTSPTNKAAPFLYSSKGVKSAGRISETPINVLVLQGLNAGAADRVLQLFEEPPKAGMVPAWIVAVPKNGSFSWVPAQGGRVFSRLYFGVSSTPGTYTKTTDGFWLDAEGVLL